VARIEPLPDDLVNKIAAGEVVERPASVVKELVENALDAGARSVLVEIENGGKALIRVRDDGMGMDREDAQRAMERHATSKLRAFSDLQQIETHGFRGEALPSIASVSHLVLRTRDTGAAGTEVELRHGQLGHVKDTGHPRGTTVEVRDLFGAVPARRKFLRSDTTEASHVSEAVTLLALARPETGFVLKSGGRLVLEAPATDSMAARLYQVFGGESVRDLAELQGGEEWARVSGFVSRPDRPTPGRPSIRLWVNGRSVRDRAVSKAILEAYRATGLRDPRPEVFLFLEVPPHLVDVNVHPAKSEVRFTDPRVVFVAVQRAVRETLSQATRVAPTAGSDRVREAAEVYLTRAALPTAHPAPRVAGSERAAEAPLPGPAAGAQGLFEVGAPSVLGQHRNTFIVASDGEDLLLVDQHTAHERVRFEALLARLAGREPESQLLLSPLVVDLEPRLRAGLEAYAPELLALGFDVEAFGGGALRLRAVPPLLAGRDPGRALAAVLRDLLERDAADWAVARSDERLAATIACHSAVRAGQPLQPETMAAIVRDLATTAHPTLCPHGRPTIVRIPRDDVSRWFGRSGWKRQ
jgi:DNA mismatch repair protein MutL